MKHSSNIKGLGFSILLIFFNLSHHIFKREKKKKKFKKLHFLVHYNAVMPLVSG